MDEKAFRRGHSYMTVVCDLMRGTVEHVAEKRRASSLEGYYKGLSRTQLKSVKAVTMDMWHPYFTATLNWIPGAAGKIVFNRFHVMQHVGQAVDTVRRREHKALMAEGDSILMGTRYLWL